MKDFILDKIEGAHDIIPLFVGEERCAPSHTFGPYIREYYIIHFCISGEGVLYDKYGEHHVGAGELFVIRPDEVTTYTADKEHPWHYAWIAFLGARAEQFNSDTSVFPFKSDFGERLFENISSYVTSPDIYTSLIYELMYSLFSASESTDKISKVKNYIKYNYMLDINAAGIASEFGFERSYLYRLFKARYGVGIKEYIIKVRMKKARALLESGVGVAVSAHMVGYSDEFNFSRAYKKYYGKSPKLHTAEKLGK